MQRIPNTVEEQLVLKSIKEECPWENLPKRLQATLASKEEWHRRVIDHCIKKRLQWNSCYARKVCKEGEYYEEMMRYLRKNLALFPYHLGEYVCRVMRLSPFRYYCEMIFETVIIFQISLAEQPYDSIPNFSAADALRLTGIGRNEFIDIMNKCRSKKLAEEEMATIDKVCKEEANSFVLFDPDVVRALFRRGLVYFDVPVYPDDRFKVSRLEGFVSNREQSYEDPIEDENATVAELAATLQADLSQLQAAASFACRLGWAVKVIDPASVLQESSIPGSPTNILSDDEDGSRASVHSANMSAEGGASTQGEGHGFENQRASSGPARVAFVVDANITSYLMMGSLSPGLKSHAVTLYEAGKLGDASVAELCKDLTSLEGKKFEGELQEFANHAFSLRCVLECLQSGGVTNDATVDEYPAQLERQSLVNDEATLLADASTTEEFHDSNMYDSGPVDDDVPSGSLQSGTPQADENPVESVFGTIDHESASTMLSESNIGLNEDLKLESDFQDNGNLISVEGLTSNTAKGTLKRKKQYRVNVLRCESLAALAPATLERLFHRDYDIIVSMVPLPSSSVIPGPSGPIHFGPPSYSSMTPWMKLALYSALGNGPLSVVLMKGQCLRLLPAPLAGCAKALIWSWDGSTVGGLGGKSEGNLVNGNILLHCLNSLLKYSAVLVQPLSKYDLDELGMAVTMDIPLPLKNSDGSVADIGKEMGLSTEESKRLKLLVSELTSKLELCTIGYARILKLHKERESDYFSTGSEDYEWVPLSLEFGVPLFSPNLCSCICERVVSSGFLQMDSLNEHHDAMQGLRRRLREVCIEYQATGPTAKILYQRELVKEPSRQLMNYASGRWNPLEPSTPISGSLSEHQRLKLANRQRCRTEVLSFDGSILRSYALSPVYEAATRLVEESLSPALVKPESDDADSKEVILPGVNLIFDGSILSPFDIGACLQARQPVSLIAEASISSASLQTQRIL
ncbi:hypothetical protein ACLOJK_037434 [Asimina triloba]